MLKPHAQSLNPRSVLITGASSGIGAALAQEYAAPGVVLHLLGRHGERLQAVANDCRAKGAELRTARIDVTDKDAMAAYIARADDAQPIDLVIANAGISAGTFAGEEPPAAAQKLFDVNLQGVLNTIHPILPRMVARGGGQVAIMASLAGLVAYPGAAAYGASKAAVLHYGDALRILHRAHGVHISVICPGWVRTPLTAINRFPMPLIMAPSRAAAIIRRGLLRRKARIAFPFSLYIALRLLGLFPVAALDFLGQKIPNNWQKS